MEGKKTTAFQYFLDRRDTKAFLLVIYGSLTREKRPRPADTAGEERKKHSAAFVCWLNKVKHAFLLFDEPSHTYVLTSSGRGGTHTLRPLFRPYFFCLMDLKEILKLWMWCNKDFSSSRTRSPWRTFRVCQPLDPSRVETEVTRCVCVTVCVKHQVTKSSSIWLQRLLQDYYTYTNAHPPVQIHLQVKGQLQYNLIACAIYFILSMNITCWEMLRFLCNNSPSC